MNPLTRASCVHTGKKNGGGLSQMRRGVLHRLLHAGAKPVVVRVAQVAPDRVLFGAQGDTRELAEWGIERMRLTLGVDQDLRPFYERLDFQQGGGMIRRNYMWGNAT